MRNRLWYALIVLASLAIPAGLMSADKRQELKPAFHTSDRCLACHNQLTTASGEDVSIGFDWRASIMGNSARDPYWQASVRREDMDHPGQKAEIEDGCADCHMPASRYQEKEQGQLGQVFAHIPFDADPKKNAAAQDGVTCSVCHQIAARNLGERASFNGGFVVEPPIARDEHPEYGPFVVENGLAHIMQTSTGGFRPMQAQHIRESAMCATCHTLYTKSLDKTGKVLGEFPEQMPYQEWLHSDYPNKATCQSCHMPPVQGEAPIASVFAPKRSGVHQHTFIGGNFFVLGLLNLNRAELGVGAMPVELNASAERTRRFLQTQTARVVIRNLDVNAGTLNADVLVQNLTGHKLPTAFPSRRAWLHFRVQDRNGRTVFESGALQRDGSIQGNDNDADGTRFEPHYHEITNGDQVEIYEPILKDSDGHVTTGLAAAVGYLKDTRLLPLGFEKRTADKDTAVIGEAAADPNFDDGSDLVRYSISLGNAEGPFHVEAELWYQPIGFRWAHNLETYRAAEPQRFLRYYGQNPGATAIVLARAEGNH